MKRLLNRCMLAVFCAGVLGSSVVRADYRAAVLADEPIAYYTLDEVGGGEGATAVNQGSLGDIANGEYFGEEFEADPGPGLPGFPADNMAIRLTRLNEDGTETPFDEASGVTVEEPILDDLTAFTLTGWINPTEQEVSQRAGLFGQDNTIEFGFIGASDVHFWAELPDGGDIHINAQYEYDNDEWTHIALVGDGIEGETFLYLNGEEVELTADNTLTLDELGKDSYGNSGLPFNIGGGAIFGADRQFAGAIDEVAVFDKALTAEQILAHFNAANEPVVGGVAGDFNGNGQRDPGDLDLLAAAMGGTDAAFDLTGDGQVNIADREHWVVNLTNTYMGDSNFDGQFNSSDFVKVFGTAKYETGQPATWEEGDWNGDGLFSSSDFVTAFGGGGYEGGARAGGLMVVPEPSATVLALLGMICLIRSRKR
ncbi:MAG: hypothetical protein KDB27_35545 [Planctomycetales bacterium]|nr:hypothetical protein [Planctomycetales bacterium]